MSIELLGIERFPEIEPGADLAALIVDRATFRPGDILVIAQKIVSKAEGQVVDLGTVESGPDALGIAATACADPRFVQVVLDQSVRTVRASHVLITETRHGYVCANGGVDRSNVAGHEMVTVLPANSDASAEQIRSRIKRLTGVNVGVIVSDTHGRAWRMGIVNVALGVAGLPALIDYRGCPDDYGRVMQATVIAVADELAGAADLVMGKTKKIPVVIVRGYVPEGPHGFGRDLVRQAELDLFR